MIKENAKFFLSKDFFLLNTTPVPGIPSYNKEQPMPAEFMNKNIFDKAGFIVSFVFLIFSFLYFYDKSAMLWDSAVASVLGTLMVWVSYIILRVIYLASKRD